jgi:hypothetical protein
MEQQIPKFDKADRMTTDPRATKAITGEAGCLGILRAILAAWSNNQQQVAAKGSDSGPKLRACYLAIRKSNTPAAVQRTSRGAHRASSFMLDSIILRHKN